MIGVYPGSFDPPTIAHLAIAEAALHRAGLERLDFALSRVALGKSDRRDVERRRRALERAIGSRTDLAVVVTDAQLVADIAQGYDVVVLGADKWAQVHDPQWYGSTEELAAALARLPRVLVAPRPGYDVTGAEVLDLDDEMADVSSSAARAGRHQVIAAGTRRRLIVDAMNVIGSRPDGWWLDRDKARRGLVTALQAYGRRTGERVAVVFDGPPLPGLAEGVHDGVLVAHARRRGRDAGDDRIVEEIEQDHDPASLTIVTSDRGLRTRVHALGARTESASQFLSDLEWEDQ